MKKMNAMEMRNIEGGATYSKKCKYCGKTFKTTYWSWFYISYLSAKATVGVKVHNHEINCFANKIGF